jgi:hypothetical protein
MGDLNVDMINMLGASILRTTAKYPGGTGTGAGLAQPATAHA